MERKQKLAQLILLEVEALEKAETTTNMINLSSEVIKDAKELAKLVQEEEKKVS